MIRRIGLLARTVTQKKSRPAADDQLQYGALPFRPDAKGSIAFLLVTSRQTRRWLIPKGWPMAGKKPHQAAEQEAREEAGIVGSIAKRPIGSYRYWKRLDATFALCKVDVYPLAVDRLAERWPEQGQRTREWFDREGAASAVDEPGLAAIIRSFDPGAS
jgi:8-oxo-dGTP pyrophosphatase MutT (NUDIX family)